MRLSFIKCHGSGNDFALVDARGLDVGEDDWPGIARALSDRAGPVGSDGLLLMTGAEQGGGVGDGATIGFRMFNSDGSEAETCLNGVRCVARMGFEALGVERATLRLQRSSVAVARADDLAPGVYTVAETAAPAGLSVLDWPMAGEGERVVERALERLPGAQSYTAVAMPNPHLVAFVEAVDERELVTVGLACEAAPTWLPNRANVSFVEQRGDAIIFVRTHERGVGLTDSCGSAMAASVVAAGLTGRVPFGREVMVLNKGGMVRATAHEDVSVTIVGNATWEWAGEVEIADGCAGGLRVLRRFDAEEAAWAALVAGL